MISTIASRGRPNSRDSRVNARMPLAPGGPIPEPRVSGESVAIVCSCDERLGVEDQDGAGAPQVGRSGYPRTIAQPAADRLHDNILSSDEVVDDDPRPA